MSTRHAAKLLGKLKQSSKYRRLKRSSDAERRKLHLEKLEARQVMATGPTLAGVLPNAGALLSTDILNPTVLNVSPKDLTFRFAQAQAIDPTTIASGIKITRSGGDGVFGTTVGGANTIADVAITPGYSGIGTNGLEVIVRFAETLPDDVYQITIVGATPPATSTTALKDSLGNAFDDNEIDADPNKAIVFKLNLGPQVVSVVPQPVTRVGGVLTQQADAIDVYFDKDQFTDLANPANLTGLNSVTNASFYKLYATRGSLDESNYISIPIQSVSFDPATAKATIKLNGALDAQISALVPDDGTADRAKALRLRIGTNETVPVNVAVTPIATDPGSSFGEVASRLATVPVITLDAANPTKILSQSIDAQPYTIVWPGGDDMPGHRNVPVEDHLGGGADTTGGPNTRYYNFHVDLGSVPDGRGGTQPSFNLITENQKQRAREIFEFYSRYSGIQFVETADQGITVSTADLRLLDPTAYDPAKGKPAGLANLGSNSDGPATGRLAVMDSSITWDDSYGGSWFQVAMHEIGHTLGQGHTYDLAPLTIQGNDGSLQFNSPAAENVFPGDADIEHIDYQYRPDSKDIDLYQFTLTAAGTVSLETIAERLPNSSTLDTYLTLYQKDGTGHAVVVARNDDYYSKDSLIELKLIPGTYYVGVTSKGNDAYDPTVDDTGMYGTSSGAYQLRFDFKPDVVSGMVDATGTALDGDADGNPGGVYNFWFRDAAPMPNGVATSARPASDQARTLFVDRTSTNASSNGSLTSPFLTIQDAVAAAREQDIIRIVGNDPNSDDLSTPTVANPNLFDDNLAYQLGFDATNSQPLRDGASLIVPKNVTVMVDAGVIFQLRQSRISVGSTTTSLDADRSGGAIQVLGTPFKKVYFTTFNEEGAGSLGKDENPLTTTPKAGDWGGIMIRNDKDRADGRFDWEERGIFLNYINNTDFRYGGGQVLVDSDRQVVTPVHMIDARPTVTFNTITLSADAAMSANPNSFEETNFRSPRYWVSETTGLGIDYGRVGPEIHGNRILLNSTNGLFIRSSTPAGGSLTEMTVSGRFDDTDIVHAISENLVISGTPAGATRDAVQPPTDIIITTAAGGGALATGNYSYRLANVDALGNEGPMSNVISATVSAGNNAVAFAQLPIPTSPYVARRLYRQNASGVWVRVAQIPATLTSFTDLGRNDFGLNQTRQVRTSIDRPRQDGSLVIDPSMVIKLEGSRIEAEMGANVIAEGKPGAPIIFTSSSDDRYGAGGTFDTRNDNATSNRQPAQGDWLGIYLGPNARGSIDQSVIAFGGGNATVPGGFSAFNAVEIQQADARVANTLFENNSDGTGTTTDPGRAGHGTNARGTIFVRGAQPIIVNNTFLNNRSAAVNINVNSLNAVRISDLGRQRGVASNTLAHLDNYGPLVNNNVQANNGINGMIVRGGTLTTESVWDDTDIVHVLFDQVTVVDQHVYGGLRLQSSPNESLVIKASGQSAGFTATGRPLEIEDRIGGAIKVMGQPGFPVVMTSFTDDSVGAGFTPDNKPQTDTNGDRLVGAGTPGEWQGIILDKFSNDRNVESIAEQEATSISSPGRNSTTDNAQVLGLLAPSEYQGDENRRLGFTVYGYLNDSKDIDVYSFQANAGTEVWVDVDRTTYALDSVVEVLDSTGAVLARSDNSTAETAGTQASFGAALKLQKSPPYQGTDFYTINPKDPGFRMVLPGPSSVKNTYFVRVRSSSPTVNSVNAGLTSGAYQMQIRLREVDEFGGSTVRYADIRNAVNGIAVLGQPIHSPLSGETGEAGGDAPNAFANAQPIGNLLTSDRSAISVAGSLSGVNDVDWYYMDVNYAATQGLNTPSQWWSTIFDVDYADGLGRPNTVINVFSSDGRLILSSRDSNISEDRPQPLSGANVDDLTRGSSGASDPYIGATELPTSQRYYIAISNDLLMPSDMTQFFQANPPNPLLRLQPINSTQRVAEDHMNQAVTPAGLRGTADAPDVSILFDNNSAVPFNLGDVGLYVSRHVDPANGTPPEWNQITMVDPFTGASELVYGLFNRDLGDIAILNGQLFSYTLDIVDNTTPADPNERDSEAGNFLQIDPNNASIFTQLGDDGITTFDHDPANLTTGIQGHLFNNTRYGYGLDYNALGFGDIFASNSGQRLIAIGNRGDFYASGQDQSIPIKRNILYQMNPGTGAFAGRTVPIVNRINPPEAGVQNYNEGAMTDALEVGEVVTGARLQTAGAVDQLTSSLYNVPDGTTFQLDDGNGGVTTYEMDSGVDVDNQINPQANSALNTVVDGNYFIVDPDSDPTNNNGTIYQFDTGTVISIDAVSATAFPDGSAIVINNSTGAASKTFEFDNDGKVAANSVALVIGTGGVTNPLIFNAQIAANLTAAINASNFGVQATVQGTRITLTNDGTISMTPFLETSGAASRHGATGIAHILEVPAFAVISDLNDKTFTLSQDGIAVTTFEFDSNGSGPSAVGNVVINVAGFTTRQQVATAMATAIRGAFGTLVDVQVSAAATNPLDPTARLVVNFNNAAGNAAAAFSAGASGVRDLPYDPAYNGRFWRLVTEESATALQINTLVTSAVTNGLVSAGTQPAVGASQFTATAPPFLSVAGTGRINFSSVASAFPVKVATGEVDVRGMLDSGGVQTFVRHAGTALGVASGNIAVPFSIPGTQAQVNSSASTIATAIAAIVNATQPVIRVSASGANVEVTTGLAQFTNVSLPFTSSGQGPGGSITGVVIMPDTAGHRASPITNPDGGRVFAISDNGGLYELTINLDLNSGAGVSNTNAVLRTTYINSSSSDLVGIKFQGLTVGPQTVEGGRYAKMLFGIDFNGRVYAFDLNGKLQPIFANGATSIATGLTDARGLAFGNLETNLWHFDGSRALDAGHGINVPFDGSVTTNAIPRQGGNSLNFGRGLNTTYNATGGAYGTTVSNEFSLAGHSSADQPVLYFTYDALTEGRSKVLGDGQPPMMDSIRVFISDNGGNWQLLGTNNSGRGVGGSDDEFDLHSNVVELFDTQTTNSWRQARIDLSSFAGRSNLRLRFDFSTAGSMNLGDTNTTGDELRTVAGQFINDADITRIDSTNFEFDMGFSLTPPTGATVADGETFTISDGTTIRTFEYDKNGSTIVGNTAILLNGTETANQVAQKIVTAVTQAYPTTITPVLLTGDNVVNLPQATGLRQSATPQVSRSGGNGFRLQVPDGSTLSDGQTITINDGINSAILEFDDSPNPGSVIAGHVRVQIGNGVTRFSASSIATRIANAINAKNANNATISAATADLSANQIPSVLVTSTMTITSVNSGLTPNQGLVLTNGYGVSSGNVRVPIDRGMTRIQVANALNAAIEQAFYKNQIQVGTIANSVTGNSISDGSTFTVNNGVDKPVTFEFDSGYVLSLPAGGAIPTQPQHVNNGDSFTVKGTVGATLYTVNFIFDSTILAPAVSGTIQSPIVRIPITSNTTQVQLAVAVQTALTTMSTDIIGSTAYTQLGLDNLGLSGSRIQLRGSSTGVVFQPFVSTNANVTVTGLPGVATAGAIAVRFSPAPEFDSNQVATAMAAAINLAPTLVSSLNATVNTFDRARIQLTGPTVTITSTIPGIQMELANSAAIVANNVVKQDEDLLRIIGHTVNSRGPLGLDNSLEGDNFGSFTNILRGQNNNTVGLTEGVYIDDIIIGYAERGEIATGSNGSNNFVQNPIATPAANAITFGEYQLEVRRAPVFGAGNPNPTGQPRLILSTTFDTNDRFAEALSIDAPSGANLSDGQTFTLSDGIKTITYEFNDITRPSSAAANTTTPGNIIIPFVSTATAQSVAQAIVNAINGVASQAVITFQAIMSDETSNGNSNSHIVNVIGPATTTISGNPVPETPVNNDVRAQATPITFSGTPTFYSGSIGDRQDLVNQGIAGQDVDLFSMSLVAGQQIRFDIDAAINGSPLNSYLRIFDSAGNLVSQNGIPAVSNDNAVPGENSSTDSYIDFRAPSTQQYFIGISNSYNRVYTISGSVIAGTRSTGGASETGTYQLVISSTSSLGVTNNIIATETATINDTLANATTTNYIGATLAFAGNIGDDAANSLLDRPNDFDLFKIDLAAGQSILLNVNADSLGSGLDSFIRIFDSTGAPVTTGSTLLTGLSSGDLQAVDDNDAGPGEASGTDSYLSFVAPHLSGTQTYYVGISSYSNRTYNAATGANTAAGETDFYQLVIAPGLKDTPKETQANDTIATATVIAYQGAPTAVLGDITATNVDLYAVDLAAGQQIGVNIDAAILGSGLDSYLRIFDQNGNVVNTPVAPIVPLVSDDNAAPQENATPLGLDSYITFRAPHATGTQRYYIGVSATDKAFPLRANIFYNPVTGGGTNPLSTGTGAYRLEITPYYENNSVSETITNAGQLSLAGGAITVTGTIGDNPALNQVGSDGADVDLFALDMVAGQQIQINLNARVLGPSFSLDTYLRIFDQTGNPVSGAFNDDAAAPGEKFTFDSYLTFTAPSTQRYYIGISDFDNQTYNPITGAGANPAGSTGSYQLNISPVVATATVNSAIQFINYGQGDYSQKFGDKNLFRDQGQIILQGSRISNSSNFGIFIDAGARTAADGNSPHEGTVRNLRELNTADLVPGVVVTNNVIYRNTAGGIHFSGDPNTVGAQAPVPFGRIVNNTLYGNRAGNDVGIEVADNAAPTLLNNIVSNFVRRVRVDGTSQATVIGGMYYQNNVDDPTQINDGSFVVNAAPNAILFVNPANNNFYLRENSSAVDSSINSLEDRPDLVRVKNPMGLGLSPILAPDRDITGLLRVDDPNVVPPQGVGGVGEQVFKDRGALDRVDFNGPSSILLNPQDNGTNPLDSDSTKTVVVLSGSVILTDFRIQLADAFDINNAIEGSGIDDSTVISSNLILNTIGAAGRVPLVQGVDYSFNYDTTNNLIILTPLGGIWPQGVTYEIILNNGTGGFPTTNGVADLAGNSLIQNQLDGTHRYTIFLGSAVDYGDAPDSYGTTRAAGGASQVVINTFKLGPTNTADTDGGPPPAAADTGDDGIIFPFTSGGFPAVTQGSTTPILVNVVNTDTVGQGFLDAWFDLNGNGVFDDDSVLGGGTEHLINHQPVNNGPNTISVTVPDTILDPATGLPVSTLQSGTWARFRLNRDPISSPAGAGGDGEVEDYQVTIAGPPYHNNPTPAFPTKYADVDDNGTVNIFDALAVLALLQAARPATSVNLLTSSLVTNLPNTAPFYDVVVVGVGQRNVGNINDVLGVIEVLRIEAKAQAGGEGESKVGQTAALSATSSIAAGIGAEGEGTFDPVFASSSVVYETRSVPSARDTAISSVSATLWADDSVALADAGEGEGDFAAEDFFTSLGSSGADSSADLDSDLLFALTDNGKRKL